MYTAIESKARRHRAFQLFQIAGSAQETYCKRASGSPLITCAMIWRNFPASLRRIIEQL